MLSPERHPAVPRGAEGWGLVRGCLRRGGIVFPAAGGLEIEVLGSDLEQSAAEIV